jgi:glutamate 5-kinase
MSLTSSRQSILAHARRVVVKMGTQLLTRSDGFLDLHYLREMAGQISALREKGFEVTLVSSGAIGAGRAELKLTKRPKDVAELQAVAAAGQPILMNHFHAAFGHHGLKVAQVLLTRDDFDHRTRFLNVRNCLARIHTLGCVPIINENDTVTVAGLQEMGHAAGFGDNDRLAALVCNALRADVMILLTVVDGLLDAAGAKIETVENIGAVMPMVRRDRSDLGSGGMRSKLEAVQLVTDAGEVAVIANGREPRLLSRLFAGDAIGTIFLPAPRKLDSRQRWIGLTKRPAGTLTIDDGAVAALAQRGKSLLASGVVGLTGQFESGEVLFVRDAKGAVVARGLSNYSSEEVRLIMGKKSSQFEKLLGRPAFAEVIHRDNLVLVGA